MRDARALTVALSLILCWPACKAEESRSAPEQVVEEFMDRMQRVHGDPKTARAAYDLLWSEAQRNLTERAQRATAAAGRTVAPEEMLAPSRFALRFKPRSYSSRVDGKWAVVTAVGETPATQRAEIHCALEGGQWRIALELPPPSPIQRRPDAGP